MLICHKAQQNDRRGYAQQRNGNQNGVAQNPFFEYACKEFYCIGKLFGRCGSERFLFFGQRKRGSNCENEQLKQRDADRGQNCGAKSRKEGVCGAFFLT